MAYRRGGNRFGNPNAPMSEGTRGFLTDLLRDKDVEDDLRLLIEKQMANGIKQGTASSYIDLLKQLPSIPREDEPTVEGYYMHDGSIYKVARARAGHMYALEQNYEGRFKELARGVFKKLSASELMSDAQVKAAGL